MAKVSKGSVNYRLAPTQKKCGNCSMYSAKTCTLVAGVIDAKYTCDRWEKK